MLATRDPRAPSQHPSTPAGRSLPLASLRRSSEDARLAVPSARAAIAARRRRVVHVLGSASALTALMGLVAGRHGIWWASATLAGLGAIYLALLAHMRRFVERRQFIDSFAAVSEHTDDWLFASSRNDLRGSLGGAYHETADGPPGSSYALER